jgi:hypothetical protein
MMSNWFARFLLVCSALSPMLGAVAVTRIAGNGFREYEEWVPWATAAVVLGAGCWLVLAFAARHHATTSITPVSAERNDKEVLGFLLAYLLPVVTAKDATQSMHWLTVIYVFAILAIVFTSACAVHFNPLLGLFQYHFYNIKDSAGVQRLLIARTEAVETGKDLPVVYISPGVVLHRPRKP